MMTCVRLFLSRTYTINWFNKYLCAGCKMVNNGGMSLCLLKLVLCSGGGGWRWWGGKMGGREGWGQGQRKVNRQLEYMVFRALVGEVWSPMVAHWMGHITSVWEIHKEAFKRGVVSELRCKEWKTNWLMILPMENDSREKNKVILSKYGIQF